MEPQWVEDHMTSAESRDGRPKPRYGEDQGEAVGSGDKGRHAGTGKPSITKVSIEIKIEQLPNGYWRCEAAVLRAGLIDRTFINEWFHDAGEALDFARWVTDAVLR